MAARPVLAGLTAIRGMFAGPGQRVHHRHDGHRRERRRGPGGRRAARGPRRSATQPARTSRPRRERQPSRCRSTAIPRTAPGASWTRLRASARTSCARSRRRSRLPEGSPKTTFGSTWSSARSCAPQGGPPGCARSRAGRPLRQCLPIMRAVCAVHHRVDRADDRPGPAQQHIARGRERQTDPVWQADYTPRRSRSERKIGHLMRRRHGGRRARVRGRTKVNADFNLLAAAVNLARLATLGVTSHNGQIAATA